MTEEPFLLKINLWFINGLWPFFQKVQHRYKSRKKNTKRQVVAKYFKKTDTTKIAYYRHEALQYRFLRFGNCWYLMIEPTYVFTTNGKEPDPYREEHLSKIKSLEGDAAISGKIVMFAEMMKDRISLFDDSYPFLGFGAIESVHVSAGIDDKAWANIKAVPKDPEQEQQANPGFGAGTIRLMNATIFLEPELEFGAGRHIDSRYGLSRFGALDTGTNLCPTKIRLGVVGDQQSIDKFSFMG